MNQEQLLHQGKCKKVFTVLGQPQHVRMEFKDTLTAHNGQKRSSFKGKGQLNRNTSSLIFKHLKSKGIANHWISDVGDTGMVVQKMNMIPLEVVVRNRLAGSTAKKFRKREGEYIKTPLFELYYKSESLGDPFISEDQALMLEALTSLQEGKFIRDQALKVNDILIKLFTKAGMDLIDFKLEFGTNNDNQIILGDEISADSCRIWKAGTMERLDKDRFRLDLGAVEEGYNTIYENLLQVPDS